MILFICGTSSVGKSTVCHALKRILGDQWLYFGMDGYLAMLGERFVNLHPDNPDVCKKNDIAYAQRRENGSYEIVVGPLCTKLFSTIPEVLSILAKSGYNIIVDSLNYQKDRTAQL